ncbi:unnamed protein product [Adineta ricciae]|nr:unnamed protein product [Adineta ricciae]
MVVGLSVGIGGFVGILLAFCICWQIVCGSWCDDENKRSSVRPAPARHQRERALASKQHSFVSTVAPSMTSTASIPSSSNDLATEQVNKHFVAYVIGESVPYDNKTKTYLWLEAEELRKNKDYYKIQCLSRTNENGCEDFQQATWGYCESSNDNSGYSILRRQFLLKLAKHESVQLSHTSCCWANSVGQRFHFDLITETHSTRINSSPYPCIPASFYVSLAQPKAIPLVIYDQDGDEIVCEPFTENYKKFLTVNIDSTCRMTYETNRPGKQFGQFWLLDKYNKQNLSRSLISLQVHVLKDILCETQPDIFVQNQADSSAKSSTIKLKQSVYISVRLNPNCALITPKDQTITELTTLCNNNQPVNLANGGVEVTFQCTPNLCEKYPVCFVGEFGLKLPSTMIQCFLIEVTGTKDECELAWKNYDFVTPRNRHFVSPSSENQLHLVKTSSSSVQPTTIAPLKSRSKGWLWILVTIGFCLFVGIFGLKQILLILRRQSTRKNSYRSSSRNDSFISRISDTIVQESNPKQMYTGVPSFNQDEKLPMKIKSKSQYIRQGRFDDIDL